MKISKADDQRCCINPAMNCETVGCMAWIPETKHVMREIPGTAVGDEIVGKVERVELESDSGKCLWILQAKPPGYIYDPDKIKGTSLDPGFILRV